jgi:hypothetical protein
MYTLDLISYHIHKHLPLISPLRFWGQVGAMIAKRPLRPIPGARATGMFTNKPMAAEILGMYR